MSEPVRSAEVELAATEYVAVPLPLPLAPPLIVSHELLLVADQVQPPAAVTDTLP